MRAIVVVAFVLALDACGFNQQTPTTRGDSERGGTSNEAEPEEPSKTKKKKSSTKQASPKKKKVSDRTVMFIDDGFDVNHPVFEDKILATYTIDCEDGDSTELNYDLYSKSELKKELIRFFKTDESCTLKKGIKFSSGAVSRFVSKRDVWNSAILDKRDLTEDEISQREFYALIDAISGKTDGVNFHGTATASVTAYDNPDVKLVLVQFELASSTKEVFKEAPCISQAGWDKYVEVMNDPEVRKAYIERPLDKMTKKLNEVADEYGVSILNLSLGKPGREIVEKAYRDGGCPPIDLRKVWQVEGELARKRDLWLSEREKAPDVLTVQAAGNENIRLDSLEDSDVCPEESELLVFVGSHNASGQRSDFSNYGDCIDLFAAGEEIVVAAPEGFLNVSSGTSFSAPMVVRYLTLDFPKDATAAELKKSLLKKRDGRGFLPGSHVPTELFYSKSKKIDSFALTSLSPSPKEILKKYRQSKLLKRLLPR